MGDLNRIKQRQVPAEAGTQVFPASCETEPVPYGVGRPEVIGD